jgi:hypothetical protein
VIYVVTYKGLAWLIIMGYKFDDWVYWHFFIITINYDSFQLMTVYDSLRSLLDHERLFFRCDESLFTPSTALERRLSCEWILEVRVKVTLRLTVSQSVSLGVEPHLGLMTRYILLFDNYGLVFVGHPLWREEGSILFICCWPSPA